MADGLPLFGGAQLEVDATLVSPLHCDRSPMPGADVANGAVLVAARRRKERTRARLVVLVVTRSKHFCAVACQGQSEVGTQHFSAQGRASVAAQMGHHLGLFGSSRFRILPIGCEDAWWG